MHSKTFAGSFLVFMHSCSSNFTDNPAVFLPAIIADKAIYFSNIEAIPLPQGFKRMAATKNSFSNWLRNIPLKKNKTVYLYNGQKKANQDAQFAVLNISVANINLQQCADAAMRLRAEYLFHIKKMEQIIFTDNAGKAYPFIPPFTQDNFRKYLHKVFGRCGTASLSKQMHPVKMEDIQPGDVLLRGGFPGHAAIVIYVAENDAGTKIYLLAQSYMPAQDIHILKNPVDTDFNPWYRVTNNYQIETPEYIFKRNELKRW